MSGNPRRLPKASSKGPRVFSPEERDKVLKALGNEEDYACGTRAGYLLRNCASFLSYSPRAALLYVLLSGFLGADKKLPKDTVRVSMKKLAQWLNCTPRTAQRAVQELARSGPLPLIIERPGRQGRVSEYQFVRDPFKIAAIQTVDALRTRTKRSPDVVAAQAAIHAVAQRDDLVPALVEKRLKATSSRRSWNTATRVPVIIADKNLDTDDDLAGEGLAPAPHYAGTETGAQRDLSAAIEAWSRSSSSTRPAPTSSWSSMPSPASLSFSPASSPPTPASLLEPAHSTPRVFRTPLAPSASSPAEIELEPALAATLAPDPNPAAAQPAVAPSASSVPADPGSATPPQHLVELRELKVRLGL